MNYYLKRHVCLQNGTYQNIFNKKKRYFEKKFQKLFKKYLNNLKYKNNTFVHRDFHASNLIYFKNDVGAMIRTHYMAIQPMVGFD